MPNDAGMFARGGLDNYKLSLESMRIAASIRQDVRYEGHDRIRITERFGPEYVPVLSYAMNIRIGHAQKPYEIWIEVSCDKTVSYQLRLSKWQEGAADIFLGEQILEGPLTGPVPLVKDFNGFLSVELWAKGEGRLCVGELHYREIQETEGTFLPGDVRHADSAGEEFFSYLNRMDGKPPLNVYFSGYRSLEGFEGYHMMRSMGAPFLLLADPRLEGGSFYLGSEEYEQKLEETIRDAMKQLDFSGQQVIMSGISMGTLGAAYYSAAILPHTVILGKPLMNAGSVAANEKLLRPGGFATSLDVLLHLEGATDEAAVQRLNHRMWDRFDRADFSGTSFAVSYMQQDDYDPFAYENLLEHLKGKTVQIYGKGMSGRHNDNTDGIVQWFKRQYRKILQEDFGRDQEESG